MIDVALSREFYESSLEQLLHSRHETVYGRICLFSWCPPFWINYALGPILYIRTQEEAIIAVYISSLYSEPLHKQRGRTLTGRLHITAHHGDWVSGCVKICSWKLTDCSPTTNSPCDFVLCAVLIIVISVSSLMACLVESKLNSVCCWLLGVCKDGYQTTTRRWVLYFTGQ